MTLRIEVFLLLQGPGVGRCSGCQHWLGGNKTYSGFSEPTRDDTTLTTLPQVISDEDETSQKKSLIVWLLLRARCWRGSTADKFRPASVSQPGGGLHGPIFPSMSVHRHASNGGSDGRFFYRDQGRRHCYPHWETLTPRLKPEHPVRGA